MSIHPYNPSPNSEGKLWEESSFSYATICDFASGESNLFPGFLYSSSIVVKPIKKENNTCASSYTSPYSKDKDKLDTKSTSTNVKLKSPPLPSVDDFDGFNWEDEEGDDILSQVDISALCDDQSKDEVFTNTQFFNVQEQSNNTPNYKLEKDENANLDSSFVTESWEIDDDFDDEDNLLQTALDEVERTQSIVNNVLSTSQTNRSTTQTNVKEQNNVFGMKNGKIEHSQSKPLNKKEENMKNYEGKALEVKVEPSQSKPLYTKVRSTLKYEESKKVLKERNPNLKVEPSQSKPLYSKAEIERKKLQAQQKLKQKQKQKSLGTKLNVYRSRRI